MRISGTNAQRCPAAYAKPSLRYNGSEVYYGRAAFAALRLQLRSPSILRPCDSLGDRNGEALILDGSD
jgi:hypothetical protein